MLCGKYIEGRGVDLFNEVVRRNSEGVVAKRKNGIYTTVSGWLKVKMVSLSDTLDLATDPAINNRINTKRNCPSLSKFFIVSASLFGVGRKWWSIFRSSTGLALALLSIILEVR